MLVCPASAIARKANVAGFRERSLCTKTGTEFMDEVRWYVHRKLGRNMPLHFPIDCADFSNYHGYLIFGVVNKVESQGSSSAKLFRMGKFTNILLRELRSYRNP